MESSEPIEKNSCQNLTDNKNENNSEIQNNNEKKEIELLKSEIELLKSQRETDQSKTEELKSFLLSKINELQRQIKSLSDEIISMKQKKKKTFQKDDNNIINDNNKMDLQESDENDEEDDHKYQLECLSRKLNTEIIQGADKANLNIIVRNCSKEKFPKNSRLICDIKNSLLLCENCDLSELEPNQQRKVNIQFNNLKNISKGEYKSIVKLEVENKIYHSSSIEFTIKVNSIPNIQNNQNLNYGNFQNLPFMDNFNNQNNNNLILNFRRTFSLFDTDLYSDQRIEDALRANNNDFNQTFESLFN